MLFAPGRKKRPGCLLMLMLLLAVLALVFGLNAMNNGYVTLVKEPVTITGLDSTFEGFRVLLISDLHGRRLGAEQQRLRDALRLESYRAVCLTGDMVGPSGDPEPLLELLRVFPEDVPVYLIAGDEDPQPLAAAADGQVKAPYIRAAEEAGAIYLDSPQRLTIGKRSLWFMPATLYTTDLVQARFALEQRRQELTALLQPTAENQGQLKVVAYQLAVLDLTEAARKEMHPQDRYILLSHVPLDADLVSILHTGEGAERKAVNFPGTASLILAGHWNDGQWRLPLLGPVLPPPGARELQTWTRDGALSGQASVHGVPMYVSPGLGASIAYPWRSLRLFNRPRITELTLTAAFR